MLAILNRPKAYCGATALAACVLLVTATPAFAVALLSKLVPSVVTLHQVPVTGAPDPNARLELDVALPMRNQDDLDAFLARLVDSTSAGYRHYLSVAEFTTRFGPTKADYDKAARFFRGQGLAVTANRANHYMLSVGGRVADIERVFHVRLNLYRHPTEDRRFIAPDREPTLDLDVPVQDVAGLDDFVLPAPRLVTGTDNQRHGTGSGPKGSFIGSDMRAAYYGGSALTGAGQSLALMELAPWNPADVSLYFSTVGQSLNVPVNGISVDGGPINCTACHDGEQALDIEYAISMAPGLAQVQVYVARSAHAVLEAMASDNTSSQLSTSWGWGTKFAIDDPLFKEMAAQGQTFLTASGDDSSLKKSDPWPEEDANLTAVGGTDLTTSGPGGPWLAETGWVDSAGGPSLDRHILIESYQLPFINARNHGSTTLRNVPDVAAHADTDCFLCANGKCIHGWGGTSFASPMWAGYIAMVNEQAAANGHPPVGFLNPALYDLAMKKKVYRSILHDAIGNKSGRYKTVKGFDLVTGLGSPDGQDLIDALAGKP